jgi:hypothetical protein
VLGGALQRLEVRLPLPKHRQRHRATLSNVCSCFYAFAPQPCGRFARGWLTAPAGLQLRAFRGAGRALRAGDRLAPGKL